MGQLPAALQWLFERNLEALKHEVESYPDDASLWMELPGISNPGGALAHHLAGNIRHFVGAVLGGTGYQRKRDAEFGARGLGRAELVGMIDAALADVKATIPALTDDVLARDYPEAVGGKTYRTGDWLMALTVHLGYHLGQVNYHRRMAGEGRAARGKRS